MTSLCSKVTSCSHASTQDQETDSSPALDLASQITVLHGTNSSLFAVAAATNYTLLPLGKLLDRGIAPMSGEILRGGTRLNGINQRWISADSTENIDRCWKYATSLSFTFSPPSTEDLKERFFFLLEALSTTKLDSDSLDSTIVDFLRLKQWDPDLFQEQVHTHQEMIAKLLASFTESLSCAELQMLELLEAPLPNLKSPEEIQAINEKYFSDAFNVNTLYWWRKENWLRRVFVWLKDDFAAFESRHVEIKVIILGFRLFGAENLANRDNETIFLPSDLTLENILQEQFRKPLQARLKANKGILERRFCRLSETLSSNPPALKLGDRGRELLASAYPVLLGSTKILPLQTTVRSEYNFAQALLGKEIDLMFVPNEHLVSAKTWAQEATLDITIYSSEMVEELIALKKQGKLPSNTFNTAVNEEYDSLSLQWNAHVRPLYQAPYPDGSSRYYHGVPHAVRASFFAAALYHLYLKIDRKCTVSFKALLIGAGLHDVAREDDGEDLWDQQSSERAGKVLHELGFSQEEVQILTDAIVNKDAEEAASLEQRVVHDADCLEIFRCLSKRSQFRSKELWFIDDLTEEIADMLIDEAYRFINMTDKNPIKKLLETSEEPYKALIQVLYKVADQFPLLSSTALGAFSSLARPSDSILTDDVLTNIAF